VKFFELQQEKVVGRVVAILGDPVKRVMATQPCWDSKPGRYALLKLLNYNKKRWWGAWW